MRFSTLFLNKKLHLDPICTLHTVQEKRFREIYLFCEDIREKTCVLVANDYADTVSVQSTTTRTSCQCSQRLLGQWTRVSVVNDYANIMSVQSTTTLTHRKLFNSGKSKKLRNKVTKHLTKYTFEKKYARAHDSLILSFYILYTSTIQVLPSDCTYGRSTITCKVVNSLDFFEILPEFL